MAKKFSIVIPNYNGEELLKANLPSVINCCPNSEIIVVDDASIDGSAQFLKDNLKNVKIIRNKKNYGFAKSANIGVNSSENDLVLLLNTDVRPTEDFIKQALVHFDKNEKLFAVGLADKSHERNRVVTRGRGGAKFKKGFLDHFALNPKSSETLWVSGGSGIFDRKKFIELGGFDENFAPFYWEDIDLSYRAWKKGYICIFESRCVVEHFHEQGAIKKSFSEKYIKTVAYKNQFLFVWKNISSPLYILQHIIWLPYHLFLSIIKLDTPFILGLIWALLKVPSLIFSPESDKDDKLSDKEILKKFEKQ